MGAAGRTAYRLWQFWQTLTARPLPSAAWEEITAVLTPAEKKLFHRLSPVDRQHSYRVMRTLQEAGYDDPALLAAALLHDVGKTFVQTAWWDRPLVVLGQALVPAWAVYWSQGEARGWARPFVVKAHHADWGAAAAGQADSSPLTVWLIRRHQDRLIGPAEGQEDRLLRLLQWADDQN